MPSVVNLLTTPPPSHNIKTVTQILPYKDKHIIILGYSPQSLKKLELIFQLYDTENKVAISTNIISKFGVIFLTSYVAYTESGSFLILLSSMGSRRIVHQNFISNQSKTIVREVKLQKFQQKARTQTFTLYYSPIFLKIYLLEQLKFGQEEHQIFLRIYEQQKQINSYRIIALEQQIPQIICSPQRILFRSNNQITLYKQNFQPHYFTLENMEQFDIIGFYQEFILQLKEDSSIFTMTLCGVIRPLLEDRVSSYQLTHKYMYFLIPLKDERRSVVKIFIVSPGGIKYHGQFQSEMATKIVGVNSEQIILGS